jgi:serine/threonine protein phosphatase PrpC
VGLQAYGISDKGRVRATNEDCFAIDETLGLCVVADGMGGHNAGEVAARLAVDAVVEFVRSAAGESRSPARLALGPEGDRSADHLRQGHPPKLSAKTERLAPHPSEKRRASLSGERERDWPFGYDAALSADGNLLRTAVHLANVHILESAVTTDRFAGMGTTIVAARLANDRLTVASAGDSRLYLLARGGLRQLTHDDSWVARVLAQDPQIDPILLQHHPMRNTLTNVIGARRAIDVHIVEHALAGGELVLLSTDGVHGALDDDRLERLMTEVADVREIARNLIAAALISGSRDNCTVIVARYAR